MTKGWRTGRLIDFASVSTGPFGSLLHKSDYVSDGVPLVNPINIVGERIVPDSRKLIDRATACRLSPYILRQGDIVVSRRGELGRCTAIGPGQAGWVCGTGCFFIRPGNEIEPRFLAAMLRSDKYRSQLESASTGATMPSISNTTLSDLLITVPERYVQQRIVVILDEAFAGIATAKANAEKSLRNAREVMDCYMQSVFSLESDVVELGAVLKTVTGSTPPKSETHYYGEFMPFVKPPELCDGELASAGDGLTELGATVARILPPQSVLVSCIGNLGKVGLNIVPVAFNQQINAILPETSKAVPKFMFFQALSRPFKEQLENLASGTTVPIVNKSKFNGIRVTVPSIQKQELIVERLEVLRNEIVRLESIYTRKLATLDELKQSLLQRAFTGQL